MLPVSAAARALGHVAVVHEDADRAEEIAHALRGAGHRTTVLVTGRRIVQSIVACSPDLLLVSQSLGEPSMAAVVRGVRQLMADELRIVVLYGSDPHGTPPEADDVQRTAPLEITELQLRVARIVRELQDQRLLRRKASELLGLYKMSWAFSLAGGAQALFGHLARHTAELLKAQRGAVFLYDGSRRQIVAQQPGYGFTVEQLERLRYPADGEAASRWNFRTNGPLLSNNAQSDSRLLPHLVRELRPRSLMGAPIMRGPHIIGILGVADRVGDAPFGEEDLNLLLALAGQATIAIENLRLHEQLKKANEELQEYDRLKSEFVGIMAHDFRKPLMAIRGFAELVLEEPDLTAEARQEFMRTVISETEHLALLANDTLLITQIETGQLRFQLQEIELGPFLLDAVPLGISDHSVLTSVPQGFPKIWVDPDRLRQVLTNLLTNALKYSPAGGSIVVRARERGEKHVVVEVVDNGLGIPSDQIGKLFQKFARVRSEEHAKVSGTGLGLYICRLIVEGHGGHIWVESELGRGSTFGLLLPIDAREHVKTQVEPSEATTPPETRAITLP